MQEKKKGKKTKREKKTRNYVGIKLKITFFFLSLRKATKVRDSKPLCLREGDPSFIEDKDR
jgi:hypothetical protein